MEDSHFTQLSYGKSIQIGRRSCDININDVRISGVHCEIGSVKMDGWDTFPPCTAYVEDKSTNGTWICRKEGLRSWGECRKLTKGIKISFSPGDFIILLPPDRTDIPNYYMFSLEANEMAGQFGLKHLTVTEFKKRTTKSINGSGLDIGAVKRLSSAANAIADGCVGKRLCLEEPVKLEPSRTPDLKVTLLSDPPISQLGECPKCLDLFPLEELVIHSESCCCPPPEGDSPLLSEPDGAIVTGSTGSKSVAGSSAANFTGAPEESVDLEQCVHCLKDFSVIELVTHVNVCAKRMKPTEDLKELEHCQYCLNLFPLDEIIGHSMICAYNGQSKKSDDDLEAEEMERCMHCFRDFPISELVRHMPECTGDMCGPKERFKGFVPSVHDIDAMALSVLNDTQREAVDYVLQRSEEDSRRVFPRLLARVRSLGYEEKDLERTLRWVKMSAPIIIHVHLDRVLGFLVNDTHYRNLFETLTGSGSTDRHARASWEDRIFNNVYHGSSPVDRVKYGVLNIVGDLHGVRACYSYGDSFLQLKKVRLRTTFASMDTSSGSVKLSCCEHYGNVLNEYSDPELKAIIDVATRRKDYLKSDMISHYKEVQIHGPVCLSENVECIVVNERFRGNELIEQQLDEFVTKNSCNLIWMEPDDTSGTTSLTTLGHFGPVPSLPTPLHRRRKRRTRHRV